MKCTNNVYKRRRRRNRKRELGIRIACFFVFVALVIFGGIYLVVSKNRVQEYEYSAYNTSIYESKFFADEICVTAEEQEFEDFHTNDVFHGSLLFNLDTNNVLLSQQAHEKLYPASTTKIMTAYLAIKYGDLSETFTMTETALDIPSDSSKAWLDLGDQLTLEDLLYSMMLPSGNESANAIAELISGSVDEFVKLMNKEAKELGATNTHFVNPHGYQDKEHYTTAYDMYLIFKEAIKQETFVDVISSKSWTAYVTTVNGSQKKMTWGQSNSFINGSRDVPGDITVVGGKTGTTYDAGACLILYVKDANETPYISIIMGASSKRNLYDNMTFLLAAIP